MPTYTYFCNKCGHEFDSFSKISDRKKPESEACPSCNDVNCIYQRLTAPSITLSIGISKATKNSLNGSKFQEKLNQIHRDTPGSQLNTSSTIVDVKG